MDMLKTSRGRLVYRGVGGQYDCCRRINLLVIGTILIVGCLPWNVISERGKQYKLNVICKNHFLRDVYRKIDGAVLMSQNERNLNCAITFQTHSILQRFMLRFDRLQLDCNDHLYIYDGAHAGSNFKADLSCKNTHLSVGSIYTRTNFVTLKYITDGWGTEVNGFRLVITAVKDPKHTCKDFRCTMNEFCIDEDLVCDTVNHCGDGSDEVTSLLCTNTEVSTILGMQKTWFAAALIMLVLIAAGLMISAISCYCRKHVTNPRHSHNVLNSRTYPPVSFPCTVTWPLTTRVRADIGVVTTLNAQKWGHARKRARETAVSISVSDVVGKESNDGQAAVSGGRIACRTEVDRWESVNNQSSGLAVDGAMKRSDVDINSFSNAVMADACNKAVIRLRCLLKQLQRGKLSIDVLRENVQYAVRVLETVLSDEHVSSMDEGDGFAEVESEAFPLEVREWLASTFTRQLVNKRNKSDEKLKFRSVAHAIRAGIFVERISRRMTSSNVLQFPPNVREVLRTLDDWSFDTFSLNDASMGSPLKYLGYELFSRYSLIRKFKIPPQILDSFLMRIEAGYCEHKNPYHNNLHAADVTQTMHFILCQTGLMAWLSDLEIFATLVAAMIHDYEHTGTTNNFHVMSGSETALLYNDRAVLENHHIAASFRVLKEDEYNILRNLSRDEYREFRSLIIDMVLATDMTYHFQQLKTMKNLLTHGQVGIDKSKAVSLVLHCCDVSHPAKNWNLHHRWTMQLLEEFFRQGDKERILGLPFSPLCDRKNTLIAESQVGFIEFIVEPSMQVCSDMLEHILGSSHKKDSLDEPVDGSSLQLVKINKPWIPCLIENKKSWKTLDLPDAVTKI